MSEEPPILVGLLLGLLLEACSLPPSAVSDPTPPPPRWSASPAASTPSPPLAEDWWRDFGDPALNAEVEEALAHNQDLVAAAARIAQADAQFRAAAGARLPQLSLDASSGRSRTNIFGFPFPGLKNGVLPIITESDRLGLSASWEADLWGRLGSRERAALAELQASAADAAGIRLALVGRVVQDSFALRASEVQVESLQALLRDAEQRLAALDARCAQGSAEVPDLLRARGARASAEAQLHAAEDSRQALRRGLEILLGHYPAGVLAPVGPLPTLPDPPPAGIPAQLLARRPDLAAAAARLRSAEAQAEAAQRDLLPRISLSAAGGTSSDALQQLLNGDFQVWSFATSLSAPLFQGGRLRAARDAAASARDQARASFASSSLQAFSEVETALDTENLLRKRVAQLRDAEEAARMHAASRERRLAAGNGDALALLDARDALFRASLDRATAHEQLLQNRVRLILALGGGFQGPVSEVKE